MPLEKIVDRVGARFLDISLAVIQADPASERQEELEHLRAEHDREDDRLATLRGQVALLSQRIAEKQEAVKALVDQVESSFRRGKSSQAMRQALELDNLRQNLDSDQAELPRLAQAVWCLEFRLRQLERHMQRLREEPARR
jgi:hypothetical protein